MSSGKPRPKISRPTAKGMGVPKRTPAGFVCSEDDIGPPPLERHGRDLDAAWADGAKSERDEVVVWLRGMAIDRTDSAAEHLLAIALEIEQGKHHIPF